MTDRRAELEAAIEDDPYDPRGFAVLGDYLMEIGDPRGELIALQLGGRKGAMEHAAGELFAQLHVELEGVELGWAYGYARAATVEPATAHATHAVLAHPSLRFLAELRLRGPGSLGPAIAEIAAAPRPSLRVLALGENHASKVGDCSALWAAVPRLLHVDIHGNEHHLGTIELPHALAFTLDSGALTLADAEAIARARWPTIQTLSVACGKADRGVLRWLRMLVTRDDLPALGVLAIHECPATDDLIGILAASPLLRRLRSLDLASGTLSDAGVQTLLAHKAAFEHLSSIDLRWNQISPDAVKSLAVLPAADASRQHFRRPVEDGVDDEDEEYDHDLYDY